MLRFFQIERGLPAKAMTSFNQRPALAFTAIKLAVNSRQWAGGSGQHSFYTVL